MTQYSFGAGTLIGKRTDVAGTAPALLGTLQEISIDFDQAMKTLMGQNKVAVDAAPGEMKIVGKAKFARLMSTTFTNLFFGGMSTLTPGAGVDIVVNEAGSPAAGSKTVANGAQFIEDLGVFDANTGVGLIPVASAPAVGQYVPGVLNVGTYTFNTGDNGRAFLFCYSFTVTTLFQQNLANVAMGTGSVFEMIFTNPYAFQGSVKKLNLKLNACRSSKLALAWKNQEYMVPEFDFTAFADAAGNIGGIYMTE